MLSKALSVKHASPAPKERRGIQSIEVGMRLLLALGQHGRPMALKDLSSAAHMPTGKAHPYLVSFAKVGFVVQDAATGYYWLGPTAIQLGLVSLQMLSPVREATPDAERLAETTGHSVALIAWGNQGPGVNAFSAPVFDYSGNIVLAITLMGSSGIFDPSWTGPQAQAIKACAAAVSKRLGYSA